MVFWSKTFKTFIYPRFSKSIISEIISLGYSSFFGKCSKFYAHVKNVTENRQKVFCFRDNGVWNCCEEFCISTREYLWSAVNVLTNRLNFRLNFSSNESRLFTTQITSNSREKRIMVVPCWLQQCLEPVNKFIGEWCSEERHFRRLSNHVFQSQ